MDGPGKAPAPTKISGPDGPLIEAVRAWCYAHGIFSGPYSATSTSVLHKHFCQWMAQVGRPLPEINRNNWGRALKAVGIFKDRKRKRLEGRDTRIRTMSRDAAIFFRQWAEANQIAPEDEPFTIRRKPKPTVAELPPSQVTPSEEQS